MDYDSTALTPELHRHIDNFSKPSDVSIANVCAVVKIFYSFFALCQIRLETKDCADYKACECNTCIEFKNGFLTST